LRRDSPRFQAIALVGAGLRLVAKCGLALVGIVILLVAWLSALLSPSRRSAQPRLLWGTTPLKSATYLSRALRQAGHRSESAVVELYGRPAPGDFDHIVLSDRFSPGSLHYVASALKAYLFFARALWRYDIFHYFFDGGLLRLTPLSRLELPLLKRVGKKVILLPYGSDAFVYDHIPNLSWRQLLMMEYAASGDKAELIERRIRHMSRHADVVVGCLVHIACLPRWDVLPLTCYPVDTDAVAPHYPGKTGTVRIAHASNHRGAKGTEFVIDAVRRLQADGHDVELDLIERLPNERALEIMRAADILVDQLLFGYALAALEGLALGKVVISGIEDTDDYRPFRRYSYLNECPIVPANPETLYDVLARLLAQRDQWPEIGRRSRQYAEHRHSFAAARDLYAAVYRKVWDGEDVDLIRFYHPLFEQRRLDAEQTSPTLDAPTASR
jgi:hypothetical protein